MDPRDRADALLSRARARGGFVVTPDDATSPMDASNTQQIPRSVVSDIDHDQDPDTTTKLSAAMIEAHDHPLAAAQPTSRLERSGPATQVTTPLAMQAEPENEEPDTGLLPTTRRPGAGRSNLARRLDGV